MLLLKILFVVPRILVLLVIFCLLAACHDSSPKSPTTTSTNNISSTASPTRSERPSLKGAVENISIYPVPNHPQDLAVSLIVSMSNEGQPSVVTNWTLEVQSPDPSLSSGLEPVHVNGIVEMPGAIGKKVDLGKEDLALMTAESPIPRNGRVVGVLTFVLPRTSEREVSNNNTAVIVHFRDSQGTAYAVPKAIIGGKRR